MVPFELAERELAPGARLIEVSGELDLSVADRLEAAIEREAGSEQLLIGLGGCQFIDSTGIAVIVRAHLKMAEQGRRLAVFGASDQVLRILSITGLTESGLVFSGLEQVLDAGEGGH
jgi:anti-sigma B factor antagonist